MLARLPLFALSCLIGYQLSAQSLQSSEQSAMLYAVTQSSTGGFSADDVRDLKVDYAYRDNRLGITYVYLQQCVGQVPIEGAIASVAIKNGKVGSFAESFLDRVAERVTSVVPKIQDLRAVELASAHLGHQYVSSLRKVGEGVLVANQRSYAGADFTSSPIHVKDVYRLTANGELRRGIAVSIDQKGGDYRYITVDAVTGEVIAADNFTQHCKFERNYLAATPQISDGSCDEAGHEHAFAKTSTSALTSADNAAYRAFTWPSESPSHGPHVLVRNPADSLASPYGWHDTNGAVGAEFTITRGNNAHAYVDARDIDEPSEPEPDGGAALNFDFPFDSAIEPNDQTGATVTNLFYAVNKMHDFAWHYGFDELAGNFQERNYSGAGRGGDYVIAQSEDGSKTNTTGTGPNADNINNANFSTPADGSRGRVQMYLWNVNNGGNPISVVAPQNLAGRSYGDLSLPASTGWEPGVFVNENTNIQTGIYEVRDEVANASFFDGCETYVNPSAVAGKIAVIQRGSCQFSQKAARAQSSGAVAVIICNFEDANLGLAAGDNAANVTIPVFLMTLTGCTRMLADNAGSPDFVLSIKQPDQTGTEYVTGSVDNGIIAHEFGHGISTRLTGGPNQSCLSSEEQMGEGWSDFFSLITSVLPGDTGSKTRGIGTYAERQETDGPGIRPFPYSTDMSINPVTYADVANADRFSAPHGIGSIWASMLWDLHWNMVDRYGFGANLNYDTLGNNKAIQLVMTGMKLQPCAPGFVDGRNAILKADSMLYGGSNQKLIWETFARRGLGENADQGDPDNRSDGTAGFRLPLDLADRTFFTKKATETIMAGGQVDVELSFANWLNAQGGLPNVDITDGIPAGASLIASTVSAPYTLNGDVLSFNFTNLAKGDTVTVNYSYMAPGASSTLLWYDPVSGILAKDDYDRYNDVVSASSNWDLDEVSGYNDNFSWLYVTRPEETKPTIEIYEEERFLVQGAQPLFTFFHKYDVSPANEGAVLEVYSESLGYWESIPESKIVRNSYTTPVIYNAFSIPRLKGYAGSQAEWEQVLINLSDYLGQKVGIRWRYARRATATAEIGDGWQIDEFAFVDALTYNPTAQATFLGTTMAANAPNIGTFVDHNKVVGIEDVVAPSVRFMAYPNPTSRDLTLVFDQQAGAGSIEIISITGQRVARQVIPAGEQRVEIDMSQYAKGTYALRVERDEQVRVIRVVRQ